MKGTYNGTYNPYGGATLTAEELSLIHIFFAAGHVLVVLAGGQVHAVPDDGAVLEGPRSGWTSRWRRPGALSRKIPC